MDAISARKALVEVCVDCGEGAALCKARARFGVGHYYNGMTRVFFLGPSRVKIAIKITKKIEKIGNVADRRHQI